MKKLYFIRHGRSQMNEDGKISGHTDTPLTDEGREQAKVAGKAAKKLSFDLIVSSPLSRAYETAKIIAKEIGYPIQNIITNELLIERNHGVMEGQDWLPDMNYDDVVDAESDEEIVARAKLVHDWLQNQNARTILVVSHGSTGRALRSHVKPEFTMKNSESIDNAQIVRWL